MNRVLVAILVVLAAASFLPAQDIQIRSTGAYVEIGRGLAWGSSNFNRNFIFTPLNPDQSACVFVVNNNPTNSHSFALAVSQTGDPRVADFSNNSGRWISDTVQGSPSPVAASATGSAFIHSNAAAKIALQFSGGTPAGGTPDTADVFVVQSNATTCGAVNPASQGSTLSSTNVGTSSPPQIMVIADSLNQSYAIASTITNGAANADILTVAANGTNTRRIYFDRVILSADVATRVIVYLSAGTGTGCAPIATGITTLAPFSNPPAAQVTLVNGACTVLPTNSASASPIAILIGASQTVVVSLQGYIAGPSSNNGITVSTPNAFTGNVAASIQWAEK